MTMNQTAVLDEAVDEAMEDNFKRALELFVELWEMTANPDKWISHCAYAQDFGVYVQCGMDEKPWGLVTG